MGSLYKRKQVVVDKRTGEKTTREGKKWWGKYVDENGFTKRVPLSNNERAAKKLLADREARAELSRAGLDDPFEWARLRAIEDHVAEFRRHLESKENTAKHVELTVARLNAVFDGCGVRLLGNLDADKVSNWLQEQRDNVDSKKRFGVTTSNHHLTAVKSFGNWLVRSQRLERNPFVHLAPLNAKAKDDVRVDRRALDLAEIQALIDAADLSDRTYRNLSGPDRAVLYLLASTTGFRANELRSLRASSFDFESEEPSVTLKASDEKAGRGVQMPLTRPVVNRLVKWIETNRPGAVESDEELWPGSWSKKAAEMFRRDLAEARAKFLNEVESIAEEHLRRCKSDFLKPDLASGETADFHAIRHTFITMAASSGVDPNVVKQLARHSSFKLTYDRYCHTKQGDLNAAIKRLPSVLATVETQPVQIIETESVQPDNDRKVVPKFARPADSKGRNLTKIDEISDLAEIAASTENPCKRGVYRGFSEEAPVGVEPTMTDLQSVALATWPRSQRTVSSARGNGWLSLLPENSVEVVDLADPLPTAWPKCSVGRELSQSAR